jgi:hypothetical protein
VEALTLDNGVGRVYAPLARLAAHRPEAANTARRALDFVLAATRQSSWPEVAWRASRLTDDGFPVEFSWTSRDSSVRWTAEVAGPETDVRERFAPALALLDRLCDGPFELPESAVRISRAAVENGNMRFGAWIAGRHTETDNRYKIYVECADRLPSADARQVEWLEQCFAQRIAWRMVGIDTSRQSCEYYGRVMHVDADDIERSFVHAGFASSQSFKSILRSLCRRAGNRYPLGSPMGVSVVVSHERPVAISWFGSANAISYDPEERIEALVATAELCRGRTDVLAALLGDRGERLGKIGMVGLGAGEDGKFWVQAGWRPEVDKVMAETPAIGVTADFASQLSPSPPT